MPTPTHAVRIGNPAATTAPKVITRMTKAATIPMISGNSETMTLYPG